jgi:hypothetical protein
MSATIAGASSYSNSTNYWVSNGEVFDVPVSAMLKPEAYPTIFSFYQETVRREHSDKSEEEQKCHMKIAGYIEQFITKQWKRQS